jgi:hypothetical protein
MVVLFEGGFLEQRGLGDVYLKPGEERSVIFGWYEKGVVGS